MAGLNSVIRIGPPRIDEQRNPFAVLQVQSVEEYDSNDSDKENTDPNATSSFPTNDEWLPASAYEAKEDSPAMSAPISSAPTPTVSEEETEFEEARISFKEFVRSHKATNTPLRST